MQSTHKTNPSRGQKVTTDPAGRRDPKKEHSGPVPADSLAADSLRRGGDFSSGNPTGISGARGSSGTFAADPGESGNVRTLHGKKDDLPGDLGRPPKESREKSKETSISGGGDQAQGAFKVLPHELESKDAAGRRLGESKHTGGGGGGGLRDSKYAGGVDASAGAGGRGSRHTGAGGGDNFGAEGRGPVTSEDESGNNPETHVKKVVPNTARPEETLEEGFDWSKVSKNTVPTTDMGGPDDPGRAAEKHLAKQLGRREQGLGYKGGKTGGDYDNSFDVLNDNEGVPEVENPSRG